MSLRKTGQRAALSKIGAVLSASCQTQRDAFKAQGWHDHLNFLLFLFIYLYFSTADKSAAV